MSYLSCETRIINTHCDIYFHLFGDRDEMPPLSAYPSLSLRHGTHHLLIMLS